MLITSNTSIKNNIAISITHIHICDRLIIKTIKFWECPSYCNWLFFKFIDRNTKCFHQTLLFFYKLSWDFSMKSKYNDIIWNWKIIFQASDQKGQQFLELDDDNNNSIEPSYINEESWLKFIGHSNSLCTRVIRAIINHTPIGEYRLCFFLKEKFKCSYGLYPIELRCYILYKCQRFNNY